MEKLVVVIMGENAERFISMSLESVKDADAIVYCDGGSIDNTLNIVMDNGLLIANSNGEMPNFSIGTNRENMRIIQNPYDQEDIGMNGKQRNFYLNYVKENYPDYWCLAIDADEVVEDLNKIKEFIQEAKPAVYSVKMKHFIGDLGHEDSAVEKHWVPNRLFKISNADYYPEVEHPILQSKEEIVTQFRIETYCPYEQTDCTTIWHLAYIPNLWEMKKRYENHLKKSNMHTPQFLKEWYFSHIFGSYPRKEIKFIEIPPIILREFGIDPDEIYFATHNRLEVKHFLMVRSWIDHFFAKHPEAKEQNYSPKILDMGCGWGMYGYVAQMFGADWQGIEKSNYACINSIMREKIRQGDILNYNEDATYDIVLLIDILEHLEEKDLDKALENIKDAGEIFIFSNALSRSFSSRCSRMSINKTMSYVASSL